MRWLISLFFCINFCINTSLASQNLLIELESHQLQNPISTMRSAEQGITGVISTFEIAFQNTEVRYHIDLINPRTDQLTQLEYRAITGELIRKQVRRHQPSTRSKIKAIRYLLHHKLTFSSLVELALFNKSVHLLRAELDHDLGISYLELELIDKNGQYRLAFDVEKLRPLPLLKWY